MTEIVDTGIYSAPAMGLDIPKSQLILSFNRDGSLTIYPPWSETDAAKHLLEQYGKVYSEELGRLRAELEAVKREAVEALKPFAGEAELMGDAFAEADSLEKLMWDGWTTRITVGHLRRARAFTEKHG